jgi:hypothetical protein
VSIFPSNSIPQHEPFPLCIHCLGIVEEVEQLFDRRKFRLSQPNRHG